MNICRKAYLNEAPDPEHRVWVTAGFYCSEQGNRCSEAQQLSCNLPHLQLKPRPTPTDEDCINRKDELLTQDLGR